MQLHHIALRTRQLEAVLAFYRAWFALPIVRDQRPRAVWLGLGQGAVLMVECADDDEPQPSPSSRELLALGTSIEQRELLRERLAEAGLLEAETEHTLYFRDPDGRRVGISSYPL
jgi:catechol 2,3-dioxygenase-like lactoylglutathione lyase family enzyme